LICSGLQFLDHPGGPCVSGTVHRQMLLLLGMQVIGTSISGSVTITTSNRTMQCLV